MHFRPPPFCISHSFPLLGFGSWQPGRQTVQCESSTIQDHPRSLLLASFRNRYLKEVFSHTSFAYEIPRLPQHRSNHQHREHCLVANSHPHTEKVHHHHGHHLRLPHSPIRCSHYVRLIFPRLVSAAGISKSSDGCLSSFSFFSGIRLSVPPSQGQGRSANAANGSIVGRPPR